MISLKIIRRGFFPLVVVIGLILKLSSDDHSSRAGHRYHQETPYDVADRTDHIERIAFTQWQVIWRTALAITGSLVSIAAGGFWLHRRHRALQSELPPTAEDAAPPGEQRADRLGERGLGRGLRAGLAQAARELGEAGIGQRAAALDDAVLGTATSTVGRSVQSGDAASVIIWRGDEAVYVVALPVPQARPQIVQRYLGAPWPEHVRAIQRAAGTSVLALVVLCGPDASEAALHIGFAPAPGARSPASDPEALLDVKAARQRGANRFRYVMTLSATPSNGA